MKNFNVLTYIEPLREIFRRSGQSNLWYGLRQGLVSFYVQVDYW